ncbi:MAG TPA: hypothetical protein VFV19_16280 [Candidatus Polarisedimenticolaceae bacterium]|nr:hypothetical protein [Candidatus Polarisedimenticolaceae bacterium]
MRTLGVAAVVVCLGIGPVAAGDERKIVGTYRLAERAMTEGGAKLHPPEVLGSMTFTKTTRTVILKWPNADGSQVSVAVIATYTLSGGKYCETELYGMQSNLGAPGVEYDTAATAPQCTAAISDATGFSFEIPGEHLRLQVTRDGIRLTTKRYTDRWEKVK